MSERDGVVRVDTRFAGVLLSFAGLVLLCFIGIGSWALLSVHTLSGEVKAINVEVKAMGRLIAASEQGASSRGSTDQWEIRDLRRRVGELELRWRQSGPGKP